MQKEIRNEVPKSDHLISFGILGLLTGLSRKGSSNRQKLDGDHMKNGSHLMQEITNKAINMLFTFFSPE